MWFSSCFVTGRLKLGRTWYGKLLEVHPGISCKGEACFYAFTHSLTHISSEYNKLLEHRAGHVSEVNEFPPLSESEVFSMMRYFIELRLAAIIDPGKSRLKFLGEKDPFHAKHFPLFAQIVPGGQSYPHHSRCPGCCSLVVAPQPEGQ